MYNLISTRGKYPSNYNLTTQRRASLTKPLPSPPPPLPSAVHENVFGIVGKTPLVKLNHPNNLLNDLNIGDEDIKCNICVKLEYLNPGGSIKDRLGKALMDEAKNPDLHVLTGDEYILEASSGNTGIAVAMNAAKAVAENLCKGCYIVTNEKCSDEKISVMKLLGAHVCLTKTDQSKEEVVDAAINKEPHRTVVFEQWIGVEQGVNQVNPQCHYNQTAEEIYTDLGQKWPDMIVMGAGSGGTFTGIATRIKDEKSVCRVVAADPKNSTVFHHNPLPSPFLVEGLVGFEVPLNLDKSLFDECQTVTDKEAFLTARNLAKNEGILCGMSVYPPLLGGSSGLAVAAAIKAVVKNDAINKPGKIVVVIMPDGVRNYMTKFVLDQWMEAHLFKSIPKLEPKWYTYEIIDEETNVFIQTLKRNSLFEHGYGVEYMDKNKIAESALKKLIKIEGNPVALITDSTYQYKDTPATIGLATLNSFRYRLTNPRETPYEGFEKENSALSKPVSDFMEKDFSVVDMTKKDGHWPQVGLVARILDLNQYVVLGYEKRDQKKNHTTFHGKYVATAKDLLIFRDKINFSNKS